MSQGRISIALYAVGIAGAIGARRVDFVGGGQREREIAERLGANMIEGRGPRVPRGFESHPPAATPFRG